MSVRITFQSLPQQTSYSSGNEENFVSDYGYDVNVYLVQYNIFHIEAGIGGLQFQV